MDLTLYYEMDEDELAALPGRIKRAIIAAITGRAYVPVTCAEVHNPVAVGERMRDSDQDAPLPRRERGQRGGLR